MPVVSIHAMRDPQVAVESQSAYRSVVHGAGNGDRLVQAYVDDDQHGGYSAPELAAAIGAVMQWAEKGAKPTPQSILAACEQLRATYDGACRYRPGFEPKAYSTRYYTREAATAAR
jgi:hypothetical protein